MKLSPTFRNHPVRQPLRSLSELAIEFGITPQDLGRCMAKYPGAPTPKLIVKTAKPVPGRVGGQARYIKWFEPIPFRKWYRGLSL